MAEESFDKMVEVEAWLNSKEKNYEAGIALLKQCGESGFLLDVLQMGATAFNRQKLLEVITAIRNAERTEALGKPSKSMALDDAEYRNMAPVIKDLRGKIIDLNKLNGNRKGRLSLLLDQSRRIKDPLQLEEFYIINKTGDLANEILDTEEELVQLYEDYEYGKLHNSLPPAPSVVSAIASDLSYDELLSLRNNLRSKKSKAKKKHTLNPSQEGNKEFAVITAQLVEVERRLNGLV